MKRLLAIFFLCPWMVFSTVLAAAPSSDKPEQNSENLISDPGFEQDKASSPWLENNWAKNDVEFARDTTNPHSGTQSERISLRHATGSATDVQLVYPKLAVKPGMPYRLRFWLRGPSNTKPIIVSLRQTGAPYRVYFSTEVALNGNWTESVFNIVLPANLSKQEISLLFELKEENTFWIDDVSLTELPAQSTEAPLVGNQIKNGSFEVGRDHWYATFRETGGLAGSNLAANNNVRANILSQPEADAPDGHHVLAFEIFPSCRIMLTSAYFHLRYGYPVSINFWMKSPEPGTPFRVGLGQGKYPSLVFETKDFTSSDNKWKFYHMVVTPKPSSSGTYYLEFDADHPGKYELDAISAVDGDTDVSDYPKRKMEMGWGSPDATPAGNLFYPGDTIHFPLNIVALPCPKAIAVRLRLVDYREHELKTWNTDVALDAEGYGQTDVSLPSDRMGGFKVEAFPDGESASPLPLTELLYSVVPHLKPPGDEPDSFFGAHVDLTPYNLAIAERVGFRWLRLHAPLSTKWMVVEPEKGKFDFDTQGVALARSKGFHLLGTLGTTPWFYADGDPAKTRQSSWYKSYPPKDWDAWRTYVQKTAIAFSPYIWDWEIWNEPDGDFLLVSPGEDKAQVYVDIVSHTRQDLDDAGIHAFLVGNAVAHLDGPFTLKELTLGGGKQVDALSFHFYGEDSGPEEKKPPMADQLAQMRQFPNRSGQVPELWDTEGGIWLNGAHSWLDSAEIPSTVVTNIEDAANTMVRMVAALKAMGVKRYFYYAANAAPSGGADYRDDGRGMVDTNGIVQPAGAAHAAAVSFLENAEPNGLETKLVGTNKVIFARFHTVDSTITVIWARHPVKLGQIAESEWQDASGFEMMGNPLPLSSETDITLDPIYLIRKISVSPQQK